MEPLIITLDGPPMGKGRVRFQQATGRTFTPERTVNYESRLAAEAQHVMAGRPLLEGALRVELVAFMPIAVSKPKRFKEAAAANEIRPTKKPDFDNIAKMLDALNLIVWTDDCNIVDGGVQKFYSDRPRLVVRITTIDEPEQPPAWSLVKPAPNRNLFA